MAPPSIRCSACNEPYHLLRLALARLEYQDAELRAVAGGYVSFDMDHFQMVMSKDGDKVWWIDIHPEHTMLVCAPISEPPGPEWLPIYVKVSDGD